MPNGTIVFFLGSPGAGKTTITKALSGVMDGAFYLNKDILARSITIRQTNLHMLLPHPYLKSRVDDESIYRALLESAAYNMRNSNSASTAIVEGNFGKRLTTQMLQESLGDLTEYDLCLVHVVCRDSELQFQRVCERNDPKDKAIVANNTTYNLTNKKSFELYRELRMQEEMECIRKMCVPGYMRLIEVDNSNPSNDGEYINSLAKELERQILGCSARLVTRRDLEKQILGCSARLVTRVASLPNLRRSFDDRDSATSSCSTGTDSDNESHTPDKGLMFSKQHTVLTQSPVISPIQQPVQWSPHTPHGRLPFLSLSGRTTSAAVPDRSKSPRLNNTLHVSFGS